MLVRVCVPVPVFMCVCVPVCVFPGAQLFQEKLDETTLLLRELQEAQRERLSSRQPPSVIHLLAPNAKELQLGKRLPPRPLSVPLAHTDAPQSCSHEWGLYTRTPVSVCVGLTAGARHKPFCSRGSDAP